MKILNLYCGIGGNRKLWGNNDEITAVEINPNIAKVYADLWPNDRLIIGDAHQYLLENYHHYDFIWTSPPCQSHSQTNSFLHAQGVRRYPKMELWQEIIFLETFAKCKWVVENVKPYYSNIARIGTPQQRGRHWFWANFKIPYGLESIPIGKKGENRRGLFQLPEKIQSINMGRFDKLRNGTRGDRKEKLKKLGFNLDKYTGFDKVQVLRNCVTPEIGLAIYQAAKNIYQENQKTTGTLF